MPTSYFPYLSLSGTSMAAPVVTGTVALMLQANAALTPNAVKAILQYTARPFASYDHLTQGTGLLNAKGRWILRGSSPDQSRTIPSSTAWAAQLMWGNQLIAGGRIMPG